MICEGIFYARTKIETPEVAKDEDMLTCKYWGKRVLAINVFEKLKKLLGPK